MWMNIMSEMEAKRKRGRPVGTKSASPPRGVLTIKVSDQEREAFKALGGAKWFREMLEVAVPQNGQGFSSVIDT